MVNRGLKTLHLRMREHMKNALMVARALEKSPRVTKVVHPGILNMKIIFFEGMAVYNKILHLFLQRFN